MANENKLLASMKSKTNKDFTLPLKGKIQKSEIIPEQIDKVAKNIETKAKEFSIKEEKPTSITFFLPESVFVNMKLRIININHRMTIKDYLTGLIEADLEKWKLG